MKRCLPAILLFFSAFLLISPLAVSAAPSISVSPTLINFGNQPINTQSDLRTVTVSNTGNSALTITEISLTGANPNHFVLIGSLSFPTTVMPGANLSLQVGFRPTTLGAKVASLTIKSDDPARPTTSVTLGGTGVAPDINVTPTQIPFGNQCLNLESAARTITISVTGAGTLTITAISLAGVAQGDFLLKEVPPLPKAMPAGTNLALQVVFRPTSAGTKPATLIIASDDPDEPTITVVLSGRGVAQEIEFSPPSIDFGSQPILKPAASSTQVEIRNTDATCPLNVTAVSLVGANLDDFVLSDVPALPVTLAPGTRVTFKAAFEPKTVGTKIANITIASNDPDEPEVKILTSGKGVAPDIDVNPSAQDFGDQCITTQATPQTITVSNTGTVSLTVTSITHSDQTNFVLAELPTLPKVVLPGASFSFTVSFRPMTAGPLLAKVSISSDDPDEPVMTMTAAGRGIGPEIHASPTLIDYGDQLINSTSSNSTVTVNNAHASCQLNIASISLGGATPSEFTLGGVPTLPKTLSPGEAFTFSVGFRPTSFGPKAATITIVSNDPSSGTMAVVLGGRGVTKVVPSLGVLDWRGEPGEFIGIPVSLSGTNNVSALQFTLSFNPALLSFSETQRITPGLLLPEDFMISANPSVPGQITVALSPPLMATVPTLRRGSGSVVIIPFKVAPDAPAGATSLLLLSRITASDADANAVALMAQTGSFWTTTPTAPRVLGVGDHQGQAGSTVIIPVVLSEGFNLNRFQFTMNYDPILLSPTATDGVTLGSLVPTGFSMNVTRPSAGLVAVVISSLQTSPPLAFSPGNGVVAQMRFQINRTATSGARSLLMLSNIVASDVQGNAINITPQSGTFTVATAGRGDVNQDGLVNAQDVIRLIQHLSGAKPLTGAGLQEADVNQDGQVNSLDLTRLTQLLTE